MKRREILEWISRGLATTVAAAIGIPGFKYLFGGTPHSDMQPSQFQRLKRLQDLPVGRPVMVPVLGRHQDAWARSEQQVVGRVWLVRAPDPSTASSANQQEVRAFNTVCPHMGCQIQAIAANQGFVCPCHRASFALNGDRQADIKSGEQNHAPRDMDSLDCRIVQDPKTGDEWVEVQFEKFETGLAKRVVRA